MMTVKSLVLSNLACLFFATTSFAGWNVKKQDGKILNPPKPVKEINDCHGCGEQVLLPAPAPVEPCCTQPVAPVSYFVYEQPQYRAPVGPVYGPTYYWGGYMKFTHDHYYNYTAPAAYGPHSYMHFGQSW